MAAGTWDRALAYARALEAFINEEPLSRAQLVASRAYVLVTGELALSGACVDLREDPRIKGAYLGEDVST